MEKIVKTTEEIEVLTVGELIAYLAEFAQMDMPVYIGIGGNEPIKAYALQVDGLEIMKRVDDDGLKPAWTDSGKNVVVLGLDMTEFEGESA